jgi:hypothetical protein
MWQGNRLLAKAEGEAVATDRGPCPVCLGHADLRASSNEREFRVDCETCGTFRLSQDAIVYWSSQGRSSYLGDALDARRSRASRCIREHQEMLRRRVVVFRADTYDHVDLAEGHLPARYRELAAATGDD